MPATKSSEPRLQTDPNAEFDFLRPAIGRAYGVNCSNPPTNDKCSNLRTSSDAFAKSARSPTGTRLSQDHCFVSVGLCSTSCEVFPEGHRCFGRGETILKKAGSVGINCSPPNSALCLKSSMFFYSATMGVTPSRSYSNAIVLSHSHL